MAVFFLSTNGNHEFVTTTSSVGQKWSKHPITGTRPGQLYKKLLKMVIYSGFTQLEHDDYPLAMTVTKSY